jgi:hypothetical protein
LRVAFTIAAEDPRWEADLRFLGQSAVQPEPATSQVAYEVAERDGAYEILRDGAHEDLEFDRASVLETLYRVIRRDALAAWPEATVIHAVTGRHQGNRFAVVGACARDRSRVALRLLCLGADIEGDHLALAHAAGVTTYPRSLRVRGEDIELPRGSPPRDELPFIGDGPSTGSWALDIGATGRPWVITTGPVDLLVHFDMNEGGRTRLTDMAPMAALRAVIAASDGGTPPAQSIRTAAGVVSGARCVRLWLGSLEDLGPALRGLGA